MKITCAGKQVRVYSPRAGGVPQTDPTGLGNSAGNKQQDRRTERGTC